MSADPLYMNIYHDVVKNIRSGSLSENVPLPAERVLCRMYHVSRTTVRRALQQLEQDNYIFKKHGNGNFVKPQVFEQPLLHFYSFTNTLKNDGILIKNTIVHYEVTLPGPELIKAARCDAQDRFHKLTRLRAARDYPLMLETTYLPKSRFFQLDMDCLEGHSLYEYLRRQYNMRVDHGSEIFYPVMPGAKERLLLHIPANLPCMALERFSYENGELIEFTQSLVRGDKYKFKVELASGGETSAEAGRAGPPK